VKSKSEESQDNLEDNTAKVNKLLQSVEEAITSATDKLASLLETPQLQRSLLLGIFRQPSLEARQALTPSVSKGKQSASLL
jgi:hypothetical protein